MRLMGDGESRIGVLDTYWYIYYPLDFKKNFSFWSLRLLISIYSTVTKLPIILQDGHVGDLSIQEPDI